MILFWTLAISVITAVACAICGVFLVVKREAFISEGLSHAVLPGIIVAFLVFQDRSSPWLIIFAGLTGLLMVWLVQWLSASNRIDRDAAMGIVFSGLFSVGVLLANAKLEKVHFHADCIIDGDLAYAALKPFTIGDWYFGPKAFVTMTIVLLILVTFVITCFKELKLAAFDPSHSGLIGFRPNLIHTVWLGLVAVTAVVAFETAGTILVVALMVGPAAAASLLANRLVPLIWLAVCLAALSATSGVWLAHQMDIPPASPMASLVGIVFVLVFVFAPKTGWIARRRHHKTQQWDVLKKLINARVSKALKGLTREELATQIQFPQRQIERVIEQLVNEGALRIEEDHLYLGS